MSFPEMTRVPETLLRNNMDPNIVIVLASFPCSDVSVIAKINSYLL